jgi:hypothetical protein
MGVDEGRPLGEGVRRGSVSFSAAATAGADDAVSVVLVCRPNALTDFLPARMLILIKQK